jgi:UDP-N-acetylglucosamine 4,6-dehydratase
LVTGGTDSLGRGSSQTVLARYRPRRLIVFNQEERKQSEMARHFSPIGGRFLRYI